MKTERNETRLARLLKKVKMQALPITLRIEGEVREEVKIRVIVPAGPGWLGRLMKNGWEARGDALTHLLACRLYQLSDLATLWRRRNDRRMDLTSLTRSSLLKEYAKTPVVPGNPIDVVVKLEGGVEKDVPKLLEEARYAESLEEIPVDREGYEEFREVVLEEFEEAEDWFEAEIQKLKREHRITPALRGAVFRPFLRKVVRKARLMDQERGSALTRLAVHADQLMATAAQRYRANPDGSFESRFEWPKVDALLAEAAEAVRGRPGEWKPGERSATEYLIEIQETGTPMEKVDALRWIWRNCRDRSALFELLLRDVDGSGSYLVGEASRQLYREIRRYLTRGERRLFAIMYLQQVPKFGSDGPTLPLEGRILLLDPILQGLMQDETTVGLVILVIALKRRRLGNCDLESDLQCRVKAALAFYKYWLATTRNEERQERKERRWRSRVGRRDSVDIDSISGETSAEARQVKRKSWFSNLTSRVPTEEWSSLARRHGIQDPRGILSMFFEEHRDQREIAKALGLTQQAVSVKIRRSVEALHAKLKEKGELPATAQWPKGKWTPRA